MRVASYKNENFSTADMVECHSGEGHRTAKEMPSSTFPVVCLCGGLTFDVNPIRGPRPHTHHMGEKEKDWNTGHSIQWVWWEGIDAEHLHYNEMIACQKAMCACSSVKLALDPTFCFVFHLILFINEYLCVSPMNSFVFFPIESQNPTRNKSH